MSDRSSTDRSSGDRSSSTAHGNAHGIVTVAVRCGWLRGRFLDLFAITGAWVVDEQPGEAQRLWAAASHRHAWHAELCLDRIPTIPIVDVEAVTAAGHLVPPGEINPRRWYLDQLDEVATAVGELSAGVDVRLDPGSIRLAELLEADLARLREVATALSI